uniref:CAZy families CBM32 protein n=1 Tax=uncultured Akkermansia sp. TaxID=512294 RepID=A0A060CET9_9BACT|nr:CAZy families CBM32 protein [uncultured Akkermansia sp.]
MNGYLRWAYNSWTESPATDSRFRTWPAGDTYQVYPGPATSIRFEKLIEGIQDFEKIRLLKEQYRAAGEQAKLQQLEEALASFKIDALAQQSAADMVRKVSH